MNETINRPQWVRRETPPTSDQALACVGMFRVCDANGVDPRPRMRYYDFTDGTWWTPERIPNTAFTHWLQETFPPVPG